MWVLKFLIKKMSVNMDKRYTVRGYPYLWSIRNSEHKGDRISRKSKEGMRSEFWRRVGWDPKVGGMDFNRGDQLFSFSYWVQVHYLSDHCHIQSSLGYSDLVTSFDLKGGVYLFISQKRKTPWCPKKIVYCWGMRVLMDEGPKIEGG